MTLFWKGVAALGIAFAGLSATTAPVQAQSYGYHDGWRADRDHNWRDRRDWRDDRRRWRDDRRHYRGYRKHCRTEWRYNRYSDRRVRVRICR